MDRMRGSGEVSERLKEHAWKVCKRLNRASRVRIPLSPPQIHAARFTYQFQDPCVFQDAILWWPRRPLATLDRKLRQGRKAATVSIDAGAEVSRRGHRLFGIRPALHAARCDQYSCDQYSWPTSRLPPRLPTSLAGPITMACESALHMS